MKIKTFTTELKVFHASRELGELDEQVNRFVKENGIKKVISVCDSATTDNTGATIGLIRALAYEEN